MCPIIPKSWQADCSNEISLDALGITKTVADQSRRPISSLMNWKRTIQNPFIKEAIARAATKMGSTAAMRTDCASAMYTPRKRKNKKRKKGMTPECKPIAQ